MASPPPNPDTRELPPGWIQQYNWEHEAWFYVNTRESPPRSTREHPLGPPQSSYVRSAGYPGYAPPPAGYGYGPPQGGYQGERRQQVRKTGGMAGLLAAGVGAGLLGGALIADAFDDSCDGVFDDGGDFGGDW
ncbi:hypothetical protein EDC04DRAFT_2628257 [Pisolithus marmoratus]|nr:hypothetical protein EDC04DRAFT_2628257 [Pisolithus marmoratus]